MQKRAQCTSTTVNIKLSSYRQVGSEVGVDGVTIDRLGAISLTKAEEGPVNSRTCRRPLSLVPVLLYTSPKWAMTQLLKT